MKIKATIKEVIWHEVEIDARDYNHTFDEDDECERVMAVADMVNEVKSNPLGYLKGITNKLSLDYDNEYLVENLKLEK